jgi:hypothetical protein
MPQVQDCGRLIDAVVCRASSFEAAKQGFVVHFCGTFVDETRFFETKLPAPEVIPHGRRQRAQWAPIKICSQTRGDDYLKAVRAHPAPIPASCDRYLGEESVSPKNRYL